MATSPDFVRAAGSAVRPIAETAFDALREAVVIVDAGAKHLPVVLANAAACRCLLGAAGAGSLVDSSLYSLLGIVTDSTVEAALGTYAVGKPSATRVLGWRFPRGETPVATELKMLASAASPFMIMLTFAEPAAGPPLDPAVERLPLDLMILDRQLEVTYANAGAVRTADASPGGILGCSALTLVPTAMIPRAVLERALSGVHYHDEAVAVALPRNAAAVVRNRRAAAEGCLGYSGPRRPFHRSDGAACA